MAYRFTDPRQFVQAVQGVPNSGIHQAMAGVRDAQRVMLAKEQEQRAQQQMMLQAEQARKQHELALQKAAMEQAYKGQLIRASQAQTQLARNQQDLKTEEAARAAELDAKPEVANTIRQLGGMVLPSAPKPAPQPRAETPDVNLQSAPHQNLSQESASAIDDVLLDDAKPETPASPQAKPGSVEPQQTQAEMDIEGGTRSPEFSRDLEDMQSSYSLQASSIGDPVRTDAAKWIAPQLPGILRAAGGNKKEALKLAEERVNGYVRDAHAERRARIMAAKGEAYDPNEYAKGMDQFDKGYKRNRADVHVKNYENATTALRKLNEAGDNLAVFGQVLYELAKSSHGGGVLSDQDVQRTLGPQTVYQMAEDFISGRLAGEAGESTRRKLLGAIEQAVKNSYKNSVASREALRKQAANMPPGSDLRKGFEALLESNFYIIDQAEADDKEADRQIEEVTRGRRAKAPTPASKPSGSSDSDPFEGL